MFAFHSMNLHLLFTFMIEPVDLGKIVDKMSSCSGSQAFQTASPLSEIIRSFKEVLLRAK